MDGDIIVHNLGLDCIDLSLLFLDFLLNICKAVSKRLYNFLCNSLLLLEFGLARLALLAPVLVLFAHAVYIISHKIDTLAQRIRALA